jgi:RNA polymerase sigma factor (TIGR02999 family)
MMTGFRPTVWTRKLKTHQSLQAARKAVSELHPGKVTQLLASWRTGDDTALERLVPLVYDELHALAERHFAAERPGHTLQATALVHEAYLRLVDADLTLDDRAHFLALAARTMRRILVDHARGRRRHKRGGGQVAVTLDEAVAGGSEPNEDVVALDEALQRLAAVDERKARVVELHFFGGLNYDETARALDISPATVDRDLRLAKAWLIRELRDGVSASSDD